jgi:ABC-type dipeptide/oligopeptide/nickel transport system ATPase component
MILHVHELRTSFATDTGLVRAVDGVSFEFDRGRTLALVGESGSGKSVTALSILRLIAPPGRIDGGRVVFDGCDLLTLSSRAVRRIRGRRIAMIFQEPMTSLNPVLTVGRQIDEVLRIHERLARRPARERAINLLKQVGIAEPQRRYRGYPHELSGGMRQRVMIAMAVACGPELLIADEPTTALDATTQLQILRLLRDLQVRTGMAILLVTHDLGVVAHFADEACVMQHGRIVERAAVADLFARPQHPYTRMLLDSVPRIRTGT